MWSEMKPMGAATTPATPSAWTSGIRSLTSGSSHGMCGAPEREQNVSSQARSSPSAVEASAATAAATRRCCAS